MQYFVCESHLNHIAIVIFLIHRYINSHFVAKNGTARYFIILRDTPFSIYGERGGIIRMRKFDTQEWRVGEYTASERTRYNPSGRIDTYVRASDKGSPSLYLFPDEWVRLKYQRIERLHWRQLVVLSEIILLFAVGFFPVRLNLFANALVSFSCAMQVQTFRKVNGYAFASTMCIGNLRSCMESLCVYARTRDKHVLHKSACYLGIILMFAVGAGVGGHCIALFGMRTIWFSCLLLLISFLIMFIKEEEKERH